MLQPTFILHFNLLKSIRLSTTRCKYFKIIWSWGVSCMTWDTWMKDWKLAVLQNDKYCSRVKTYVPPVNSNPGCIPLKRDKIIKMVLIMLTLAFYTFQLTARACLREFCAIQYDDKHGIIETNKETFMIISKHSSNTLNK